jgi:hypothetical protein
MDLFHTPDINGCYGISATTLLEQEGGGDLHKSGIFYFKE